MPGRDQRQPSGRRGNGGAGVAGHSGFSTPFSGSHCLPETGIGPVRAGVWESFDLQHGEHVPWDQPRSRLHTRRLVVPGGDGTVRAGPLTVALPAVAAWSPRAGGSVLPDVAGERDCREPVPGAFPVSRAGDRGHPAVLVIFL